LVTTNGKLPVKYGNLRKWSEEDKIVFAFVFDYFYRFHFYFFDYHYHFRLGLKTEKNTKTISKNRKLSFSFSSLTQGTTASIRAVRLRVGIRVTRKNRVVGNCYPIFVPKKHYPKIRVPDNSGSGFTDIPEINKTNHFGRIQIPFKAINNSPINRIISSYQLSTDQLSSEHKSRLIHTK
jgi:hypothetical protein